MASDGSETKIIAGLGNPGRRYEQTRHNLGFVVVEQLVDRFSAEEPREAFDARIWQGRRGEPGQKLLLLQPQTYMNRSGRSVGAAMRFYKVPPENLLVVMDDLDLQPGQVRVRASGSPGGHKGLADIQRALGTDEVPRLRIGIGSAPPPMEAADYVLMKIEDEDQRALYAEAVETAARAAEAWVTRGVRWVMDRYNRRAEKP